MKNVHEIEIKVEGKEWEDAITKSFNKNVQNVKVDGFRKGKVPRNIFEKKFGKESLYNDAIDFVLQEKYATVINDSKLIPIIQPTIDIKEIDDEKLVLTFRITTKPEVKVEKYTKLGVKKGEVKVTDEEVKSRINSLLEQYADIVIKDGKIENGDTAVIDFEGFKDGVAFDGGKGENYPLEIGSNTFIPGFEEQLIGLKAGDEKDIKVTFPEDYASEELKGQEAVFKIKVHEVKTKELPEMDEEFFKDLGYEGVETEEQLKDLVKADLEAKQEYELENKYVDDLLEEAAKHTVVDLPEELVHEEIHRMMHQYEENLKMQGITLDMFYQFTNSSEEDLEKQKRRIIDVYNAFNEDTPNEIKKIKMVERLPFRTALRDYERYFKIQCILSKLLYNGTHDFNVYKVIPYYEAISLDDIEKIKEYLENNGIYLKNENFIKDKLCNYGEIYKDEDGIKKDFDRLSHHHEYILKENSDLIIRRYSELCIYNMLKNNLKSYEEIKWVSKDVCDALGYNIIVIDKLLSSVKMINVKSTYLKNDPLEDCLVLTKEEYKKLEESNKNNVPYIMYKINYDLDNFVAEFYKIEHKSNGIYAVTNLNDNTTYESTFVKDNETDGNMKIKIKETIKVKEEPHKLKLKLS